MACAAVALAIAALTVAGHNGLSLNFIFYRSASAAAGISLIIHVRASLVLRAKNIA
jgi:hypothetical protein